MDIYKTKVILQAVEQIKPVNTFLRTVFFPFSKTLLTEDVLIDSKKGKRKVAPFVAPRVGGVVVSREGYKTNKITAPRIAPERALTIDDISSRLMGEAIESTKTPEQRQAEILGQDIAELTEMIDRREELMVRELLFSNKIPVKGYADYNSKNTVDMVIDYGKKEEFKITNLWNTKEANIFSDLKSMREKIVKESGVSPNILIMASDVIDALLENEKFMKLLDTKNINVGQIDPKILVNGANYWGRLTALGIDLYSYDEWFLDDDNKEKAMIPEGSILMGSQGLGTVAYGLVTQMEQTGFKSYEGSKVPKIWDDMNNDIRKLRITSRPIPIPTYLDSWITTKVI